MPAGWTAAAIAGSGAVSGISSLIGSGKASSAAKQAAEVQKQMYLQTRADLSPYNTAGQSVLPNLTSLATSGPTAGGPNYVDAAAAIAPGQMTQAQLEQTPGYQFTRDQGLKSVQSAAAARGLGVSGASLKGAADYATGLADKTYLDQFNVAQQRFTNQINLNTAQQGQIQNQYARLQGTAALGESAGAQTGTIGATSAANQGNYLNQAGLAQAAGTTGVSNALTGAVNSYLGYQQLQQMINKMPGTTLNQGPAFTNPGGNLPAG